MNIINRIYKGLNVLEDERTAISLLLAHSFFVGVFLSYYLAYANGLFLKVFEPKVLPWTYVLSGVVGFIASSIFSYFQKRVAYSWVVMGTLVTIFLMVVGFIIGIQTVGEQNQILVFAMFMALIPVFGLVAVQYGGMTMKLFDLRQGKRLFGVIASGEVISSMIWFFTIPIILQFLPVTWYLLIVSLVGLGLGIFFQWIIVLKFPKAMRVKPNAAAKAAPSTEKKKDKGSIGQLLKNKYFSLIFFLMIFSTLGRVFVDYSFMDVSRQTFGNNLTAFFGIFFGLLKVIELIINTFLAGRLLSRYGVRLGLIILPFLLTVFAMIGIVSYWFGMAAMIFLAFAMNKLFDKTVRTSLEAPSFKTLYQPLDGDTKFMVQTQTEGNAGQMAVFIAGGLLILFNQIFPNFSMIESTYFLCFILAVWLFISRNTIKEYRNIVIEKLYDYKENPVSDIAFEIGDNIIAQGLNEDDLTKERTLAFLKRYNPSVLTPHLSSLLKSGNPIMQKLAFELIEEAKLKQFHTDISQLDFKEEDEIIRLKTLEQDFKSASNLTKTKVNEYINSEEVAKHLLAINKLDLLSDNQVTYLSEKLITSKQDSVAYAAINFIGNQSNPTFYQNLINNLDTSFSSRLSYYQLSQADVNIVEQLRNAFSQFENEQAKGPTNRLVLIKIIKILKEINTPEAQETLLSKISISDYGVRQFAIAALKDSQFQVAQENRLKVKQAIEDATKHCTWILAAKSDLLKDERRSKELIECLNDEYFLTRREIFSLLSFIYEPEAINQIVNNLESNLQEREVLAIEMSDILLDEDIKEIVFPLIDRISDAERIKQLSASYPQLRFDFKERLKDIINYDYSRISTWTKTIAIRTLSAVIQKVPFDIIAHVYNQDVVFKEVAYQSIFEKSEQEYYKHIGNESPRTQIRLNRIVGLLQNDIGVKTIADKVEDLKQVETFKHLPTHLLLKLATIFNELTIKRGETLKPNRRLKNSIFLVVKGNVKVATLFDTQTYEKDDLIGLYQPIKLREEKVSGIENSFLLHCKADAFFELIQVYDEIADAFYKGYLLENGRELLIETTDKIEQNTNILSEMNLPM